MGQNTVGLIADRELAQLFNSLGYQVIGGPDFHSAARRLQEADAQPALIVVVDQQAPGFGPWIEQQALSSTVRIIPSADGSLGNHPLALPLPTTPSKILSEAGLPSGGQRSEERIGLGGTLGWPDQPSQTPFAEAPSLQTAPAENSVGDPDFVPEPIPMLTDDDQTPTPRNASFSVPVDAPLPGGGAQPAWLNQAVADYECEQPPLPSAPPNIREHREPTPPNHWAQDPPWPQSNHADRNTPPSPVQVPPAQQQPQHGNWDSYSIPRPEQPRTPQLRQESTPQATGQWQEPPQTAGHQQNPPARTDPWQQQPIQPPMSQQMQAPVAPDPQWGQIVAPQESLRPSDFRDQRSDFYRQNQSATREACVLVSWAAKGGVAKTSLTLATAQIAGKAGLRVLVIDANRGQASVTHNLRVEGLPTIYDANDGGAIRAVVKQETLMQRRPAARGPIYFDVVMGPPKEFAGPTFTPAALYASVLAEVRRQYDLIVIDTQILEAEGDMTDVWTDFLVPQLRSGAWGIGIFDESASGLDHLDERLTMLVGRFGVPNGRLLAVSSMWKEFTDDDAAHVSQIFAGRATLVGSIEEDPAFADRMTAGFIPTDATGITPVIRQVLHQITGNPEFQLMQSVPGSKVSRLFRRRKK